MKAFSVQHSYKYVISEHFSLQAFPLDCRVLTVRSVLTNCQIRGEQVICLDHTLHFFQKKVLSATNPSTLVKIRKLSNILGRCFDLNQKT